MKIFHRKNQGRIKQLSCFYKKDLPFFCRLSFHVKAKFNLSNSSCMNRKSSLQKLNNAGYGIALTDVYINGAVTSTVSCKLEKR